MASFKAKMRVFRANSQVVFKPKARIGRPGEDGGSTDITGTNSCRDARGIFEPAPSHWFTSPIS